MARVGVIDLGTNTFHLLIVDTIKSNHFEEVYRERKFIHLAEEGIEVIGKKALDRAGETIHNFKKILDQYEVMDLRILGTEALRKARNGSAFVKEIESMIGYPVEIIDGDREADLIFKGVGLAVELERSNHLIMDIGGGSVEFIISIKGEKKWAYSFPIGVAVLQRLFHHKDPITEEELTILDQFLISQLTPLFDMASSYKIKCLTGASGSFEVIGNIVDSHDTSHHYMGLKSKQFYPIYEAIIKSSYQERLNMKGIPPERAQMIVVAIHLIYFILENIPIRNICISDYAIKEGVIAEMIENF